MAVSVEVVCDDVVKVRADVLLLKYAHGFHGADEVVARRLAGQGVCSESGLQPAEGRCVCVPSQGAIAATEVLYVGTPSLFQFRYREMQQFARKAVEYLAATRPNLRTLALTCHGANYGLDIEESFRSLVTGLQQALTIAPLRHLERVIFVERQHRRYEALRQRAADVELLLPPGDSAHAASAPAIPKVAVPTKKFAFVAMPFSEEFEDVYQFGIYGAVRRCGYICEKVDQAAYGGSIVERITEGIRNATFVVADLSLERPNVYLEVGFAWGLQRPVILVAREGQKLHFDLAHHKCLFYKTIGKLSENLEATVLNAFGRGDAS